MDIASYPKTVSINYARIGRHLRDIRKLRKLKQANVAEALDVKVESFGNMERSQQKINLQRLIELCVLYGIMPGDVLNDCCDELIAVTLPENTQENPDKTALFLLISKCSDKTLKILRTVTQALYDCLERKC